MKTLVKALLVLGVALPAGGAIGGAVIAAKNAAISGIDATITNGKNDFTMSGGGYTLNLDKRTLHFTIEKGGVTFDSGATLEDDMEITSLRAGFLESAVSLWGLSSNAGESSFAIFDGNHKATTKASVEALDNALVAHLTVLDGKKADPTLSMSFDLEYRLEEDGLSLALTNIVDNGSKNVLSAVSLYPGFNMSYGHVNGSFLIPDGSGALIDLSSPTHAQSPLSLRTYGKDIGISSSTRSMESSYQLALPMYGEYDEEKAMMVTVEEGSEYSELNSKVAGMIDNYNTTYFRFILRDTTYQYLGLSESSKKPIPQSKANNFTPRIHYHLYDEKMDYNGLASKYQSYLLNKGFLKKQGEIAANMRLEFLMGDSKKALFGKTYVPMTSSNFIKTKVAELAKERESLTVDLKGYTVGGFENSYPSSFPIDGAIGNVSELAKG
ncbi:MAG: hypothetical protein II467_00175, partial [Bacilli bacterium]|nr:hypothetical protein [Bacilli bacterium]